MDVDTAIDEPLCKVLGLRNSDTTIQTPDCPVGLSTRYDYGLVSKALRNLMEGCTLRAIQHG